MNMPRFFTVDLAKNEIRTIGMVNHLAPRGHPPCEHENKAAQRVDHCYAQRVERCYDHHGDQLAEQPADQPDDQDEPEPLNSPALRISSVSSVRASLTKRWRRLRVP